MRILYLYKSTRGFSLISTIIATSLLGILVVVGAKLTANYSSGTAHLEMKGEATDVRLFVDNSFSCSRTLADQSKECEFGEYIEVRDHIGRTIIPKHPQTKRIGNGVGLRARCKNDGGIYSLNFEYNREKNGKIVKDKLTGKAFAWKSLTNDIPIICPCINLPSTGSWARSTSAEYNGLVRTSYFTANEAVDPSKSGFDPSTSYGHTPFTPKADDTMAVNVFNIKGSTLADYSYNQQVQAFEMTAFTHQFHQGLDRVGIDFSAGGVSGTVESTPNIYSSYGYIYISNIKKNQGKITGEVALGAFDHFNGATALGIGSLQDATPLIQPMAAAVAPLRVFNGVDLNSITIKIRLYADSYDSVQYRAIRANLWAPKPVALPARCM